jgi:plastocyanin
MEQAPKPAEAPKPKNRNMLLAVIIVVILIVVGIGVYIITLKPSMTGTTGTPISIWDNAPGTACADTTTCGFHNSTGGSTLTITPGTKVTWTNTGSDPHTVTACVSSNPAYSNAVTDNSCPTQAPATFDSGSGGMTHGSTYSFTFTVAGTYNYYCQFHPWMHGVIIVT